MTTNGAGVGNRGRGRPKGSPNRTTKAIKDVLTKVLEEHQSEVRLRDLRDSDDATDRSTFWRIAAKLIPSEVSAKVEQTTRLRLIDLSDQRKDDGDG